MYMYKYIQGLQDCKGVLGSLFSLAHRRIYVNIILGAIKYRMQCYSRVSKTANTLKIAICCGAAPEGPGLRVSSGKPAMKFLENNLP